MSKQQVPFELVKLSDIPSVAPEAKPAASIGDSQWGKVLAALQEKGDTHGIRVKADSPKERERRKSTLQTYLKNHDIIAEVMDDEGSNDFFAWVSDKDGRRGGPRRRKGGE